MGKYVIELDDEPCMREDGYNFYTCKTVPWWSISDMIINRLTPYTEPDEQEIREKVEKEVWEFARKMISTSGNEVSEMWGCVTNFGEVMHNTTYSEAKTKYEEWRKQKDEIHEYDEIISEVPDNKAVIVRIDCWGQWHCVNSDGIFMVEINQQGYWKKTGRSFPELGDVLKKMREE